MIDKDLRQLRELLGELRADMWIEADRRVFLGEEINAVDQLAAVLLEGAEG